MVEDRARAGGAVRLLVHRQQLQFGVCEVGVQFLLGLLAATAVDQFGDHAVAPEVGKVELLRVGHGMEHQPQFGQCAPHHLVDAWALSQGGDGLVEVEVGGADVQPGPARGRRLSVVDCGGDCLAQHDGRVIGQTRRPAFEHAA